MRTLLLCTFAFVLASCDVSKDNLNPKAFYSANQTALFNSAQLNFSNQIINPSVNYNILRLFVQYWTETTYTGESNYDVVSRTISTQVFKVIYSDVLLSLKHAEQAVDKALKAAIQDADKKKLNNQKAVLEVMSVWAFSNLVETFGDVPYSEALDAENTIPKYDDAATIYSSLLNRLQAAIESIDVTAPSFDIDNVYGGDTSKWKKLAASLYLRMGMVLADVNPSKSKEVVGKAVSYGLLSSNSDNALQTYTTSAPNRNPVYEDITASGRKDFVVTSTLVDAMSTLKDPRMKFYYTEKGGKVGSGYVGATVGDQSPYANYSHITDAITKFADRKGLIFDYAEVEFLLAEAAARGGYAVPGTAKDHYDNAIKASITYWGATDADASTYLAQPGVDYANPASGADYKEKIGKQLWVAMYDRSDASWLHWRRLDYPRLVAPKKARENLNTEKPPYRMTYPIVDQTLNGENYRQAASNIGGNLLTTKLFFDIY